MISLELKKLSQHFYSDSFVLYLVKYIRNVNYINRHSKVVSIDIYLSPIKYAYIWPYRECIENDIKDIIARRGYTANFAIKQEKKSMVGIDYLRFFVRNEEFAREKKSFHREGVSPLYLDLTVDKTIHLKKINREFTIGRDKNSDMILLHDSISRNHAKIVKNQDKYLVYDLNSKNGTFYNNRKVRDYSVVDGNTEIQFGKIKCDLAI